MRYPPSDGKCKHCGAEAMPKRRVCKMHYNEERAKKRKIEYHREKARREQRERELAELKEEETAQVETLRGYLNFIFPKNYTGQRNL